MQTLLRALTFITWPTVLPLKTIPKNPKKCGLGYLAGIILGYIATLVLTAGLQWLIFPAILVFVGLIWGTWIAETEEKDQGGELIATFFAGFLLALPLHFLLSHLFIGFIFKPFN